MTATRLDIIIEQGADYVGSFTVNHDLAGYAAAMQIKYAPDYPYAILTLTSGNGGLVISGTTVTAFIPKSVTATLNPVRYVYDLKLFDPECLASRPFQGTVCVSPQVTDLVICPLAITRWDQGGKWDDGLSWDASSAVTAWDEGGQWDSGLSWDTP